MDRTKYLEKGMMFLNDEVKFKKLAVDPTRLSEGRIQRTIRELFKNKKIKESEYRQLYPVGSCVGRFFGTAKIHKLISSNSNVDELPIRPIVSNLGTATYAISKYLAKLLQLLSNTKFSVRNSAEFIKKIKDANCPRNWKMVSFDVYLQMSR